MSWKESPILNIFTGALVAGIAMLLGANAPETYITYLLGFSIAEITKKYC